LGGILPLVSDDTEHDAADAELARNIGDWITELVFDVELETATIDDIGREMVSEPRTFRDLNPPYHPRPPWVLSLILPEIGGGRFDESQLAVIAEHPNALALRISGLDQTTFERLVAGYGRQFLAIEFFKCPRIEDLSPLEDLPDLRLVDFFWNQRATRLWNLSRNPSLTGLKFEDFIHLRDLRDLELGASLRELEFGDAIWPKSVFKSLEPLTALRGLRSLDFNAKRIDDGRIEPVGELTGLERLTFPSSMFTTRQVAWLRARLPASLKSESLAPVRHFKPTLEEDDKDVLLVGKRKPFLNSVSDAARIKKHVDGFWQMVEDFRRDTALKPD
jgi:hypothetical protein